jgi:anti-sigma-K factor RskA
MADEPVNEPLERLLRSAGRPGEVPDELSLRVLAIPDRVEQERDPVLAGASVVAQRRPSWLARRWESLTTWRVATVGFAAAAVVLAVVAVVGRSSGSSPGTLANPVALKPNVGQTASGEASFASTGGPTRTIRVRIDGLAPTGKGFYELWLSRTPTQRVSVGVFRPDARGRIDAMIRVPELGSKWTGLWLTREPPTGHRGWSKRWIVKAKLA